MYQSVAPSFVSSFVNEVCMRRQKTDFEVLSLERAWPIIVDFVAACGNIAPAAALRLKILTDGGAENEEEVARILHWLSENNCLRRNKIKGEGVSYRIPEDGAQNFLVAIQKMGGVESGEDPAAGAADTSAEDAPETQEDHLLPRKLEWIGEEKSVRRGVVIAFIPAGVDFAGHLAPLPGDTPKRPLKTVRDEPGYLVQYKGRTTFKTPAESVVVDRYPESETALLGQGIIAASAFAKPKIAGIADDGKHGFLQALENFKKSASLEQLPSGVAELLALAESEIAFYEVQRNAIGMLLRTSP